MKNPRPKPKSDSDKLIRLVLDGGAEQKHGFSQYDLPPTPPAEDVNVVKPVTASIVVAPLTPPHSGRSSPAIRATPRASLAVNLVKSFIVFGFSGLHHDWGSFTMMLDAVGRGETVQWLTLFSLSPFFLAQPLALAFEAVVKKRWRAFKHARGWPPGPASTFECAIGFAWTWIWLGWTAGWFVQGMSRLGVYRHWPDKTFVSALWWVWGI